MRFTAVLSARSRAKVRRTDPHRESVSFTGSETVPAGELCDFEYQIRFTIDSVIVTFVDTAGNVVREHTHIVATITHTNADTGYTLTETGVLNATVNVAAGVGKTVGIQWHLRDPEGKIVLTVAGRLTYRLDPFEIIKITPRGDRFVDFLEVICPLLGGHAA